jgi:hypothetical protein
MVPLAQAYPAWLKEMLQQSSKSLMNFQDFDLA